MEFLKKLRRIELIAKSAYIKATNGALVKSKTITIDHTSILTLPTTPVDIVSTDPGKFIIPIIGFISIDASAGAYTDVVDASLILHDENFNYLSSPTPVETQLGVGAATPQVVLIGSPMYQDGAGSFNTFPIPTQSFNTSTLGTTLQVSDNFSGLLNYTGGNAANTIKVTVYYIIADL